MPTDPRYVQQELDNAKKELATIQQLTGGVGGISLTSVQVQLITELFAAAVGRVTLLEGQINAVRDAVTATTIDVTGDTFDWAAWEADNIAAGL